MRAVRRILALGLFVAVLVVGWRLATENSATVSIHYVAGETGDVLLWAALLVAFALGAATISLLAAYHWARLSMVARRYRRAVRKLEAEVHQLRNLPSRNAVKLLSPFPVSTFSRMARSNISGRV